MAKTVKMCDMYEYIAAAVFVLLNDNVATLERRYPISSTSPLVIITDVEPKNLVYPEGWYYAKGTFRNKHMSSDGRYGEVEMIKSNGELWREIATYCTLDDN